MEQPLLAPLPRVPYDLAVWKQVRVYRDCYVQVERACARALAYEAADYPTIRRILEEELAAQPPAPAPAPPPAPRPYTFARGAAEFVASLMGGGR